MSRSNEEISDNRELILAANALAQLAMYIDVLNDVKYNCLIDYVSSLYFDTDKEAQDIMVAFMDELRMYYERD